MAKGKLKSKAADAQEARQHTAEEEPGPLDRPHVGLPGLLPRLQHHPVPQVEEPLPDEDAEQPLAPERQPNEDEEPPPNDDEKEGAPDEEDQEREQREKQQEGTAVHESFP